MMQMYSELEYNTFAMSSLKDATMNLNSNIIWFASLKYKETENYFCKTVFLDQRAVGQVTFHKRVMLYYFGRGVGREGCIVETTPVKK